MVDEREAHRAGMRLARPSRSCRTQPVSVRQIHALATCFTGPGLDQALAGAPAGSDKTGIDRSGRRGVLLLDRSTRPPCHLAHACPSPEGSRCPRFASRGRASKLRVGLRPALRLVAPRPCPLRALARASAVATTWRTPI